MELSIGAQNINDKKLGSYTGEVSGEMVYETGARYVILGHSERRAYFNETNKQISQISQMSQISK